MSSGRVSCKRKIRLAWVCTWKGTAGIAFFGVLRPVLACLGLRGYLGYLSGFDVLKTPFFGHSEHFGFFEFLSS